MPQSEALAPAASRRREDWPATPAAWADATLKRITHVRGRLDHWVRQLESCLGTEAGPSAARNKQICELTRMVAGEGESLHNFVQIYLRWSGRPRPPEAWSADLIEKVRALMKQAHAEAGPGIYNENCRERMEFVEKQQKLWGKGVSAEPPRGHGNASASARQDSPVTEDQ